MAVAGPLLDDRLDDGAKSGVAIGPGMAGFVKA
jgi:hypothetical protein